MTAWLSVPAHRNKDNGLAFSPPNSSQQGQESTGEVVLTSITLMKSDNYINPTTETRPTQTHTGTTWFLNLNAAFGLISHVRRWRHIRFGEHLTQNQKLGFHRKVARFDFAVVVTLRVKVHNASSSLRKWMSSGERKQIATHKVVPCSRVQGLG
ncbi:unnamed protein product [Brassica napus]|uniref:(rape) hypothetical protein n=1 Tax=Brassica napus TaxID=3708 RepID=A0A816K5C2_BRANA|nr:unnamed protein product [Brassica napus]